MPEFDSVQNALEKLGATVDASESHGTLCGLLLDNCGMAVWLQHTLDELPNSTDVIAVEHLQVLKQLFEVSREQLNTDDLSFELLLPDDSDDFGVQLLGLSTWCLGFLYGLGVTAKNNSKELDEQSQECLSDLLEISKLDHDEIETPETEDQLVEIVEHVRVAVLFLNEAINRVMPTPQLQ
jgi:uncharacterized protein YgfB (UPF0149 family)|tara:strand:- start:50 stop:592 length:543 start_codon:yes stop_codon:yes gene_type:complete